MKNNMAKTAFAIFKGELAMIPALIMCIYDAFDTAMWEMSDTTTFGDRHGDYLVGLFFDIWEEIVMQRIPVLVCLAVAIAIVAATSALYKARKVK